MPPRIVPPSSVPRSLSSQCPHARLQRHSEIPSPSTSRQFHASGHNETRLRRDMWAWLKGPGKAFRHPLPDSTNYLSAYDRTGTLVRAKDAALRAREERQSLNTSDLNEDEAVIQQREEDAGVDPEEMERRAADRAQRRMQRDDLDRRDRIPRERPSDLKPYPQNQAFRSQPVLSENLRQEIYRQVVENGLDVNSVSAVYGIDVRRVAAVARLMTIEKQWVEEGKELAKPYNDAVLQMLPQTPFRRGMSQPVPHEGINDLPVHPWTRQQVFYPASESRQFTREDAAKVFNEDLLPADERIPNKHLIQIQKWENEGLDRDSRRKLIQELDQKEYEEKTARERKEAERLQRSQVIVPGRRWDFKFTDVSVEMAGKDGRGRRGVGHRYGMPHEDRKRGQVKIPTSVE